MVTDMIILGERRNYILFQCLSLGACESILQAVIFLLLPRSVNVLLANDLVTYGVLVISIVRIPSLINLSESTDPSCLSN